jgi:adenylate cyclase
VVARVHARVPAPCSIGTTWCTIDADGGLGCHMLCPVWTMSRVGWAATLGLLTGTVGLALSIVPSVSALEDSLGLKWLFFARGTVAPPPNVTVVSIDEAATARAGFPQLLRDWPRSLHARLVDRLVASGASVIAFDIEFFRRRDSDEDDLEFARAITRARRVVLVQRFEVARVDGHEVWQRRNPIPTLADAAFGLAPVPVPDAPVVSWFWSFLRTPDWGELPSLPAVALQVHAAFALGPLLDRLQRAGVDGLAGLPRTTEEIRTTADLLRLMQIIRSQVSAKPSAIAAMTRELQRSAGEADPIAQTDLLRALVELYSGSGTAYLNFFGPPGTICTVPYDKLLAFTGEEDPGCSLRDSIIFVGLGHGRVSQADQPDTYHTIYESADGVDFSGVELHATALANLLTRTSLHTPSPPAYFATVLLVGLCFGAAGYWMRSRKRWVRGRFPARLQAAVAVTVLAGIYCGLAYVLFRDHNFIIPLVIPVMVQVPTALIFGLLAPPTRYQEQVKAVCLATDAEGSTALGQRLSNEEYSRLLYEYNQQLSKPVWLHGGSPLAPEGDGFIGVWCSNPKTATTGDVEPACRLQACLTAIEIAEAADRFNVGQPDGKRLPVRIGMTAGTVTIHSDADRGVFTALGDVVNVSARLRDLNRELGTRIIASDDVVKDLDTKMDLRPLVGTFSLKGVARPPVIFEVKGLTVPT